MEHMGLMGDIMEGPIADIMEQAMGAVAIDESGPSIAERSGVVYRSVDETASLGTLNSRLSPLGPRGICSIFVKGHEAQR